MPARSFRASLRDRVPQRMQCGLGPRRSNSDPLRPYTKRDARSGVTGRRAALGYPRSAPTSPSHAPSDAKTASFGCGSPHCGGPLRSRPAQRQSALPHAAALRLRTALRARRSGLNPQRRSARVTHPPHLDTSMRTTDRSSKIGELAAKTVPNCRAIAVLQEPTRAQPCQN